MNISFLTEKLPYSQISGTKVGPSYKKRRQYSRGLNTFVQDWRHQDGTMETSPLPLMVTNFNVIVETLEEVKSDMMIERNPSCNIAHIKSNNAPDNDLMVEFINAIEEGVVEAQYVLNRALPVYGIHDIT